MIALSESRNELERDMIIDKVIDSTFVHTDEAKEAKHNWRTKLVSKMK
jgi:hypothetical protein